MASLAGKADPTLAKMAYAASMANVPGDYSKHYQSAVDAHKELMGGIEEIAAGFKLENDLATLEFKKAMKIFEDPLNLQMIDSDYTEMQADITAQREEWKANKGFKNDPEGRQDWDRRNQQIIGRHEQDNANLGTVQAGIDGKLYDIENMEVGKKKYLTNLAKYQANQDKQSGIHNADATKYMKDNPNATPAQLWKKLGIVKEGVVVKFKDPVTGEYTYVSKVGEDKNNEPLFESQKSSELLDYVNKDARADDTLVKAQALYQDRLKISKGRSDNYSGFRNEDRNALEELLDTDMLNNPNTLKYMMHKKIGGEKLSFAEALRSGKALGLTNEIIIALGATKSDGDDILTESDFATANSYEIVVNNILSGKATYEVKGKTKSVDTKGLYLDYTMDNAFKTGHNQYKKKVDKDKDKDKDDKTLGIPDWTYPEFGRGTMPWKSARNIKRSILSGKTFKYDVDGDGKKETYDYINGSWYENWVDEDNLGKKIGSADDLVFNVLETEHEAFQGLETIVEGPTITEEGEDVETANQKTLYNNILDDLDVDNDDTASTNLNTRFGLTGSRDNPWMFMPYSGTATKDVLRKEGGTNFYSPDAGYTNDIMIYNSRTGDVIESGGKRMRFKIGDDANDKEIDKILKALKNNNIYTPNFDQTQTSTSGNLPIVTWEEED